MVSTFSASVAAKSGSRAVLPLAILLTASLSCFAAKTDVIYTKNGDRITGEIKKLQRGVIHIDPSYGKNVFQIDWDDVARVESSQRFIIETSGGKRVSGSIKHPPDNDQQIVVDTSAGPVAVERPQMVGALPFDVGFWSRMAASIDLGTTVTKSNGSKQANVNALVGYNAEKWRVKGTFNLVRNTVGEEETRRWEGNVGYSRFIRAKWFGLIGTNFLKSDELQVDLRTTVAPGVGRFFKRTSRMYWSAAGGAQWTNERFADPELSAKSSAEAWAGTEINLYDIGDVSWLTQITVSPGLTEPGRVRLDFNTDFKIDLPKDLYFRVGLRDNFDSQPSSDAPRNDYVFSLGLGWEL
jgi:uncharacterized protein DUF481